MSDMQKNLDLLADLSSRLIGLDVADKPAIIAAGADLEALKASCATVAPACAYLKLALDTLQAAYQEELAHPHPAMLVAARAMTLALGHVRAGTERIPAPDHAELDALATAARQCRVDAKPAKSLDLRTILNGLAARFMIISSDDAQGLSGFHGELVKLCCQATGDAQVAAALAQAAGALVGVVTQTATSADDAIASASAHLESAMQAAESEPVQEAGEAESAEASPLNDAEIEPPLASAEPLAAAPCEPAAPKVDAASVVASSQPAEPPANSAGKAIAAVVSTQARILPADADTELIKEYMTESLEHIAAGEVALLSLEKDPAQAEPINVIFRAFHTIKGTSGFMGLEDIQRLAHVAESLLDRARTGEIQVVGVHADLSLRACDMLRSMIQGLEGLKPGDPITIPEGLAELTGQLKDPTTAAPQAPDRLRLGDILVAQGKVERTAVEETVQQQGSALLGEALVRDGKAGAADVVKALRTQKEASGQPAGESAIRVNTQRLDQVIDTMGELVIAHAMVAQDPMLRSRSQEYAQLARNIAHASKIIRELQDLSMSLRMVPLKATFQKMARLVRDVARKSGKQVELVTEGEDTEIDRNMVDMLNDPLVHMIRNAVDHGVEAPEVRQQGGKNPTGTVTIRAYHSAGSVVIELRDDGKGLDREKLLKKARERGLVADGSELSDREVFELIFAPGFSTAEVVSDVSGRGVGMDVVRKNVQALRGQVDIASTLGAGSLFTVRLPLTMAIIDAMVVHVSRERYLLPIVSVEQSFRPKAGAMSTVVGKGEMVRLRNELLPVLRLHKLFGLTGAVEDASAGLMIVVQASGGRCAILVDELLGQQQVVIKSLGRSLANVPGVAGAAILGDGRVGLILEPAALTSAGRSDVQAA